MTTPRVLFTIEIETVHPNGDGALRLVGPFLSENDARRYGEQLTEPQAAPWRIRRLELLGDERDWRFVSLDE